jgi:hypothetical protein
MISGERSTATASYRRFDLIKDERTSCKWSTLVSISLLFTVALGAGRTTTPDSHLRLAQARNIVNNGTFAVPEGVGNPMHGNLVVAPDGTRYSVYNPGQILLFVPCVWLAKHLPPVAGLHYHYTADFIASFLGLFVHFLTAVVIIRTLESLTVSNRDSLTCGFIYAFATFGLPHATDGYEHPYEALGIAISIYCLTRLSTAEDKSNMNCASAGLAIGFAALFRVSILAAIPGLLVIGRSWRQRLWFLLGVAPGILLVLFYNYARFQSPFETGYQQAWLAANPALAQRPAFEISRIFTHLLGLWLSSGKGMLLYSPVLLLLIPIVAIGGERLRLVVGMMTIVGVYSLFYAANFSWHGSEWCWGPRYLIPTLVPMIVLIGISWPTPNHHLTRWKGWTSAEDILRATILRRFAPATKLLTRMRGGNQASLALSQPCYAMRVRPGIWKAVVVTSVGIQILAVSVSYQRLLLTVLISNPDAFRARVLYNPRYSPLLRQITAVRTVLSQAFRGRSDLALFVPEGPWRNEWRTASAESMLSQSIDLNTLHLWWIRACYFPLSRKVRAIACLIGLTSLASGLYLLFRTWRKTVSAATG